MEGEGFLLLCSHLGNPQRRPLTTSQMRLLCKRVLDHGVFAREGELTLKELAALGYGGAFAQHILDLLEEDALLKRYLQKAANRKCVPITRQNPVYPVSVRKKLALDSPGCLWSKGDLAILKTPMIALVGCRALDDKNRAFAEEAGKQAALQGFTLVSGNATGADQTAQRSCLAHGGKVICVIADALHSHLEEPNILYLSEEDYDMAFSPYRALHRNRVIHALGAGVLVAQSRNGQGGTWSGTTQNLQSGWSPVCVYQDKSLGAQALCGMGARPIGMEQLADLAGLFDQEPSLI